MLKKNYLKGLRAMQGKNQSDIAKILNISLQSYHKKENGKVPFKANELKTLSDYFNVPIENFFNKNVAFEETKKSL